MRTSALAGAAGLAALAAAGAANAAQPLKALTSDDAAIYASAFQAADDGDFESAEVSAQQATDKSLYGYLQFQRLMSAKTRATYDEVKGWLAHYADLPGADRVLKLARKKKPAGEPEPQLSTITDQGDEIPFMPASAKGQAAREAFYSGDVQGAYRLAAASGERWIAGLSAFRLKKYDEAVNRFRAVATDPGENEWLRAGAGYWAARSVIAAGQPDQAPEFLRIAAASPATFYGMLAERQLGLEPGADPNAYVLAQAGFGPTPPSPDRELIKVNYQPVDDLVLARLVRTDPRARRAVALVQVGRTPEAAQELKAGLAGSETEADRLVWTTLAYELNSSAVAQVQARKARTFDPDDYPTPKLDPVGGFTVDRALVYAVVRQESRFDPYAVSHSGAVGLMQLMPGTAALATGDPSLSTNSSPLYDPSFNLKVGQDYLQLLLARAGRGDMIRAVAAYNGGPGAVLRAESLVGDQDPLLLMECLPAAETRGYVEKVLAGYWIYRRMFGEGSRSLDAVASGAQLVNPGLDR